MTIKRDEVRVIINHIPNGKRVIVFDVGAYIGQWTAHVRMIHPRAEIHAFEPVRGHFEKFSANHRESIDAGKIAPNHCALYKEIGGKEINTFSWKEHNASFYKKHNRTLETKEIVMCDTVDCYCGRNDISRIDFLKIDAEGSDYEVLLGAAEMIKAHVIDKIQFEFWDPYDDNNGINRNMAAMTELLAGYDLFGIGYHDEVPVTAGTKEIYGNYLAIRKGL